MLDVEQQQVGIPDDAVNGIAVSTHARQKIGVPAKTIVILVQTARFTVIAVDSVDSA
jgi:hypothetical protein